MTYRVNLRSLQVFACVFEAGSATEAAGILHVTQPAISKTLSQLETELGFHLFTRVRGRLYPTADAKSLYARTQQLLGQVKLFQDSVDGLGQGRQGRVAVGAVPALASSLVAQAAARLRVERPLVSVEVVTAQSERVVSDASHHMVDFGLTHSLVNDRELVSEVIGETEIVAVVPDEHPLSGKKILRPQDLADVPLITLDAGSPPSHLVRESFEQSSVPMRVVFEANSSATAHAAVCAGVGIALIDPWAQVLSPTRGTVLRRFQPRIPLRVVLIHSVFRPPSNAAVAMCSDIKKIMTEFASREGAFVRVAPAEAVS